MVWYCEFAAELLKLQPHHEFKSLQKHANEVLSWWKTLLSYPITFFFGHILIRLNVLIKENTFNNQDNAIIP